MKELLAIQTRLVAPKNLTNTFGKYNYRSLESIMEAVKPLLKELKCTITFTDDIVMIGNRIFCKSTATLKNEQGECETSTSFAELDTHKGMSAEQSTGSSSSYARKYAACSLLAIDDNADPDMLDNRDNTRNNVSSTNDVSNIADGLKSFCAERKGAGEDLTKLKGFYDHYLAKSTTWKGYMDYARLWDAWKA